MFTVLRSSAGAGKTHALVKHYLRHCLNSGNSSAYRQVLALTFTNKAASEMKERVIRYLEQLGRQDLSSPALRDVMDDLTRCTGKSGSEVAGAADQVLEHMLHHWSEVAISTIDAFTRRVVRPFARDLQLDHDLRMTTDHEWYHQRAVQSVIAEAGLNEQVTRLLTAACTQLIEDEARWDPALPLREIGRELDKEASIAPLKSLHDLDATTVLALTHRLRQQIREFELEVRSTGQGVLDRLGDAGLGADDLAHGRNGIFSFFSKLAGFGEEWLEPGANVRKTIESGKFHATKAQARTVDVIAMIAPWITEQYGRAVELLEQGQRQYFVRSAVLRELPSAFVLIELERHLQDRKAADGVTFFSDLTRRVAEVVRDEPAPFIFERLGERYRHFLLDEFQDTSLLQWRTLLPLIHHALSTGGSALLVGDAKQAIYRWRNGEVRLFSELPLLFPPAGSASEREQERALHDHFQEAVPLAANRRSAAAIITFNNALFRELSASLSEDLRKVYAAHEQDVESKGPGSIRLQCRTPGSAVERAAATGEFLLRSVEEAIQDGFAPGDIAVLVRTSIEGQRAADRLTEAGYRVTSPDGLRLAGHPLVECLIDLLRVLHLGDRAAATRVMQHRARLSAPAGTTDVDPFTQITPGQDPLALVRSWLTENGGPVLRTTLTDLLLRLARLLGDGADAYLLTLLDEAHDFASSKGQDIAGFLEHWERAGKKRNTAPPVSSAVIQVMTVHKAKGLEFPVVIMPSTRMSSSGSHAQRLWIDPGPAVPELKQALVKSSALLRKAGIPEVTLEDGLSALDDLDLLYVAFTRPVQRLYALVPSERPDAMTKALLEHIRTHGADGVVELGERTGPWRTQVATSAGPINAHVVEPRSMAVRFDAPAEWDPADPDPLRRHGNAVHAVLASIRHAGDLSAALNEAVRSGTLEHMAARDLGERLHALLTQERLAPWYGADVRARTEVSIIDLQGREHRPDRVVFDGDIVRVLDIKTGGPDAKHHDQVRSYMDLLTRLGHRRVEGTLLYIIDGTLTPVAA